MHPCNRRHRTDIERVPNSITIGRRTFALPRTRTARIALGSGLVFCGLLGFLPILGFWMIPLGLVVLSQDIPAVRRFRRRLELRYGRYRERRRTRLR